MKFKIRQAKSIEQVFGSAYWHLERGDLSVLQLEAKLKNKTENEEWVAEVISSLLDRGLLKNDYDFASYYVAQSSLSESFGPKRIKAELTKKRIPESIVLQVFEEIDIDFDARSIAVLGLKHPNGYNGKKKSSIVSFLVNKGFSYSQASAAIDAHGFLETLGDESAKAKVKSTSNDLTKLILKLSEKNKSYKEICAKAYSMGFDSNEIKETVACLNIDFSASAKKIAEEKSKARGGAKDVNKIKQQLLAKGFSYADVASAIQSL